MKRILLAVFCFSSVAMYAQKASDKAVKQACVCMDKVDMGQPSKKLDAAFEKCLMDAVFANLEGLTKEYKFSFSDEGAAEKVGEQLGIKLASSCPSFLEYAKIVASKESDEKTQAAEETESYEFAEGVVKEVPANGSSAITIEETSGDIRTFYLVDYFIGAEDIPSQLSSLKGKKVKLGYTTKKVFDTTSNSFKDKKVIVAFELEK